MTIKKLMHDWYRGTDEGGGSGSAAMETPPDTGNKATAAMYLAPDPDLDDEPAIPVPIQTPAPEEPPTEPAPTEPPAPEEPPAPTTPPQVDPDAALEVLAKQQGISVEDLKARLGTPATPAPATPPEPTKTARQEAVEILKAQGLQDTDDEYFEKVDDLTSAILEERQTARWFQAELRGRQPIIEQQIEQLSTGEIKLPKEVATRLIETQIAFGHKAMQDPAQQTMALDLAIGYHVRTCLAQGKNPLVGMPTAAPAPEPEPTPAKVTPTGGSNGIAQGAADVSTLSKQDQDWLKSWAATHNGGKTPTKAQIEQLKEDGLIG